MRKMDLKNRSFLKLADWSAGELTYLLDLSAELKAQRAIGVPHRLCEGGSVALIFEKPSTRTRCAFEVAAFELGLHPVYLDPTGCQLGKKESVCDTARVLGRMFRGIEYRGFAQSAVEELAAYAGVPVWNGLTDEAHPTQVLADLLTLRERFGALRGLNFVYIGDARFNMCNSLMVGCVKLGINFTACAPEGYLPAPALREYCAAEAGKSGCRLRFETEPTAAAMGADAVYTDVWVSMGEAKEAWDERIRLMLPYRVTEELMAAAAPNAIFMHCLPAFHDLRTTVGAELCGRFGTDCLEVTDAVFEGDSSLVFDQAENRLHTAKAVMTATLGGV